MLGLVRTIWAVLSKWTSRFVTCRVDSHGDSLGGASPVIQVLLVLTYIRQ